MHVNLTCCFMQWNIIIFRFESHLENFIWNEPRHDKTNKMSVRPAKTGIRPVYSESSLYAVWVAKDTRFLHADSEDSDQTGRMPKLIWVFAGRTVTVLILTCRGSNSLFVMFDRMPYINDLPYIRWTFETMQNINLVCSVIITL